MKNLKNNRKKLLKLILIFIIILGVMFKIAQSKRTFYQEDLIFFKLFGIGSEQSKNKNKEENEYKIKVTKGENNYQEINLLQSIDRKTLVKEKIAPGTKGYFYVFLSSNNDIDYEIEILSKNRSPKNFRFEISEKEGSLEENKVKKVKIDWEWPYEINEEANLKDTKDGRNIETYIFEICTIGK